ncbi:hypothetical protein PVAND_014833 [Polypedilum vanderplanki]|uniref:Uncharacterized protein n=1 Tax=Polypedilum vanderplanki TaxID=319348 RepID=A0A9J6BAW5_POLVA|nr:hypothetical protein PVAND_014833 [Polypedilum vanderplanki]
MVFKSRLAVKISILLLAVLIFIGIITGCILYANFTAKYSTGAVASNGIECAGLGRKIFEKGGTVADVAVTTILCEGIASPQSCGVGGGFILVMYLKNQNLVKVLNARERAPRNSTADMYVANPRESSNGGKAVAVPGDIKGLWELHQNHGKLPWKDLLQPIIDLCRNGIEVSITLAQMIKSYEDEVRAEAGLREIFINQATNETFKAGEKYKNVKLAETLEIIARDGADAMYGGGEIGKKFVEDVQKHGGIMIEKDLRDYRAEWITPVSTTIIDNSTLYTASLPSSGSMLALMLNLLRNDDIKPNAQGYHRIIEAMKIAFAHRTRIGAELNEEVKSIMKQMSEKSYADSLYNLISDQGTKNDASYYGAKTADVDDKGTAHLSILALNGDAISVTNTINDIFGAMFRSEQTGIIPNDEMDDFSVPGGPNSDGVVPSPNNFAIPGNNPISSMVPTIVVDANGEFRMAVGAAGGRRIISSTFTVLYRHLYFKESLEKAMNASRFHHQLTPMELVYEPNFDPEILTYLNQTMGHRIRDYRSNIANVVAISKINGEVFANYDIRRSGSVEIFEGI